LTLLGRLYLDRAGEVGGRGLEYDLAEKMLEKALALAPDSPPTRHLLSSLCAKRGRPERTVTLIREGLAAHPFYAGFHTTLGYVLRYAGLMNESMAAYRRAQQLDAGLESLVSTQGQITKSLIYQGDYANAAVSHRQMLEHLARIQRAPNEKQVFYEGVIHLYAGDRTRAIECFRAATAIDPDSVWTVFGRAYQAMLQNDRGRVADIVEGLEQRVVVDGERRYRLVHFCAFLGRRDAALEHLKTAIEGGFFNAPYIGEDPLLDSLRAHPRFARLLEKAKARQSAFRRLLAGPQNR
jgi:tetratricopeptide (TPR) repeat protein